MSPKINIPLQDDIKVHELRCFIAIPRKMGTIRLEERYCVTVLARPFPREVYRWPMRSPGIAMTPVGSSRSLRSRNYSVHHNFRIYRVSDTQNGIPDQ